MLVSILLAIGLAVVTPGLYRLLGRATGVLLGLASFGLGGYYLRYADGVAAGEIYRESVSWVPLFGVEFSAWMDGLSLVFVLIITGVGGLVFLYASRYMQEYDLQGRFFGYLMLFEAAMLGVALSGDVIALIVFWELTSISSFLLIGFDNDRPAARRAALQSLIITGGAGLALLAGVILLTLAGGSSSWGELLARGQTVRDSALYPAILVLVLIGAGAKSAQWPFHVWLPAAMEAPSPVSAYLHSAAMVKAGIYLLARVHPVLGGTDLWAWLVGTVGMITMAVGAWRALGQTDLKRMLAYSTVSVLGALVMLAGVGGEYGIRALIVYLVAHALYKSSLFLMAGTVDHEAGTRDIRLLRGLGREMPLTAAVGLLAGLSMAGIPLTFGFSGKELLLEAGLQASRGSWLFTVAAVLSSVSMVAVAAVCGLRLWWGERAQELPHTPHRAPLRLDLPPLILASAGALLGVWPALVDARLLGPAVGAVAGAAVPLELHVWPIVNLALALSAVALAGGAAVYFFLERARRWEHAAHGLLPGWLADWYPTVMHGLSDAAYVHTRWLQNGRLRSYVMICCIATVLLAGYTLIRKAEFGPIPLEMGVGANLWALIIVFTVCWVAILLVRQVLSIVVLLGGIGFSMALVFLLHGGIDLGITQVAVEALSVLLFVLVLYQLPQQVDVRVRLGRLGDVAVALAMGGLIAGALLAVVSQGPVSAVAPYYLDKAYPEAHGLNVVTVILLDFRALDTLGEITVLGVASLGVFALLRLEPRGRPRMQGDLPLSQGGLRSRILVTTCLYLLPLLLLLSLFLLLRGHEQPGGGFVAGLVGAMAFALYAVARDARQARAALRVVPRYLVGTGLLLAVGSGIFGVVAGQPFLTGLWAPGGSAILAHAGTPVLLDLGVYLLVIGSALTIFFDLVEMP